MGARERSAPVTPDAPPRSRPLPDVSVSSTGVRSGACWLVALLAKLGKEPPATRSNGGPSLVLMVDHERSDTLEAGHERRQVPPHLRLLDRGDHGEQTISMVVERAGTDTGGLLEGVGSHLIRLADGFDDPGRAAADRRAVGGHWLSCDRVPDRP